MAARKPKDVPTPEERINHVIQVAKTGDMDAYVEALLNLHVNLAEVRDYALRKSLPDSLSLFPSQRELCLRLLKGLKIKRCVAQTNDGTYIFFHPLRPWKLTNKLLLSLIKSLHYYHGYDDIYSTEKTIEALLDIEAKHVFGISLFRILGGRVMSYTGNYKQEGQGHISRDSIWFQEFGLQWECFERLGKDTFGLLVAYLDD